MPFISIIVPSIPEESKDEFLAAWPTIAAEIKASPHVLGVSAGPVVGEDGAEAVGFKFIQTIAFATKEDEQSFIKSDWAVKAKAAAEARGMTEPPHATFEIGEIPKDQKPKAYTQFSRIVVKDEAAGEAAHKAWTELCAILGKESMGGVSISDEKKTGLGFIGWDSLEEVGSAKNIPGAKEAWEKYRSFGECNDVMVKMEIY